MRMVRACDIRSAWYCCRTADRGMAKIPLDIIIFSLFTTTYPSNDGYLGVNRSNDKTLAPCLLLAMSYIGGFTGQSLSVKCTLMITISVWGIILLWRLHHENLIYLRPDRLWTIILSRLCTFTRRYMTLLGISSILNQGSIDGLKECSVCFLRLVRCLHSGNIHYHYSVLFHKIDWSVGPLSIIRI